MKTFDLIWSPEGRRIAIVKAPDARAARRKAPQPWRKYLGEILALEVFDNNKKCGDIPSQCVRHQGGCR